MPIKTLAAAALISLCPMTACLAAPVSFTHAFATGVIDGLEDYISSQSVTLVSVNVADPTPVSVWRNGFDISREEGSSFDTVAGQITSTIFSRVTFVEDFSSAERVLTPF